MSHFTLADDDDKYLFLIYHQLVSAFPGKSIASFTNAEDALTHILSSGTKVLITDHTMGPLCGTGLIRELRQRGQSLPIIMVSGDPEAEIEARAAGASLFLHKDDALQQLVDEVRKVCEEDLAVSGCPA